MSLKDALAGIKEAQTSETPPPSAPQIQVSKEPAARSSALPAKATGKSSNPDYEPVKLYIRKKTRKDASRKWEDADGGDFSDLVQNLLTKYLSA